MDMALRSPRRSLCCGRYGIPFGIKPACGSFSQSFPCCKDNGRFRTLPCMVANSDDSRRRSKKGLIPKPKGNAPKGFSPRPQVGKSTQRKDQNDSEEKESAISSSSHYALAQSKSTDMEAAMESPIEEKIGSSTGLSNNAVSIRVGVLDEADEQDYMIKDQTSGNVLVVKESETIDDSPIGEKSFEHEDGGHARKHLSVDCSDEEVGKEEDTNTDGGMAGMKEGYNDEEVGKEGDPNTDGGMAEMKEGYNDEEFGKVGKEGDPHTDGGMAEMKEGYNDEEVRKVGKEGGMAEMKEGYNDEEVGKEGGMAEMKEGYNDEEVGKEGDPNTDGGMAEMKEGYNDGEVGKEEDPNTDGDMAGMKEGCSDEEVGKEGDPNTDGGMVGMKQDITDEHALTDESWLKQKQYVEAQTQIMILKDLARENLANGNKVFVFPQTVKPDQNIEVFLNRSLSTLINENEVYIMGAFNAWRWKSFKEKLQKTNLEGDWWSCLIYVPKEAYMIDFVFFNGGHMYENNNAKDFSIPVEGGMDEFAFEDFMLEEKRKELERLAAEQAERERHAEEQLRREVEKAAIEADRAQAKLEVEKKRESLHRVMPLARTTEWDLWHIQPSIFKAEDRVRLYYNRSSRPLADAIEIWIHGGHNNWSEGLSIVERLVQSEKKDGDWWYAEVVIPDRALVLDWVFADGPPQNAKVYDNNNHIDFHAAVPKCMSEELFWVEEEHKIFRKLQGERKATEEAIRQKTERTARMKAETKERTRKMFLLSRKHIIYTEPLDVQAGTTVTIFYNPSSTILSGKPEVWFRCSFNCWTHCNGPLPPQKMFPSDCGSYLKARVKVPLDAYVMDFVFSEREDGGVFDNKYGMDYHIPVYGGIVKVPPMHIVHIAVEVAPIAKVGGLGDVVTSLSRAVQDLGHHVDIIMPKYDCMNLSNVKDFQYERNFFWGGTEIKVWFGKVEGLPVYFLEPQNGMFWVGCVYGKNNDAERFEFFCHAALEYLLQSGSHPDILHCHDWSSAPVAWLFKEQYRHYGLSNARVIFTIHNLEFGAHFIGKAMAHADKATTVSHTYSKEVSGNSLISPHLHKFHGILNGIDPDIWDPYNDKFIPVCYTSENVVEGKKAAKTSLQQRLGLRQSDHPLVGIITRLTVQKGIHLIKHAIWRTLERNGQVVLLGSSPDPRIQNDFVNLANQLHFSHADRVRLCLTYDEPLSHLIYAGSDFILVPSLFEPCGLTQLIAMRYGAIPVVRRTGGLYDTVFDVDNDKERAQNQGLEPNGFSFEGTDTAGVDYALNRAISAWYDGREWFNCLCKRVMEQDWSWNRPALDYMELYHSARK